MSSDISLFQAMGSKMSYLNRRQAVISQNIANADTPNYQPSDLTKVDFGRTLKKVSGDNSIQMVSTNPGHLPAAGKLAMAQVREQKDTYEVAPDKNGVVLEEQLIKSNDVQMDYNLMINLYRQNTDLIRTALGKGR